MTLRCTGANIDAPQIYDVYRNGFSIGVTGVGTTAEYVDAGFMPGTLCKYEARTRFDQFPPDYASARGNPAYIVTLLAPDQPFNVVTPLISDVSPAWVDGDSERKGLPVEFAVDGVSMGPVRYYNDKSWYADAVTEPGRPKGIPLHPERPVELAITGYPGDRTVRYSIEFRWRETDLSRHSSGETPLHIRKGDSLLLTARGTGTLLEIDGDGDGVYELSGVPGQTFPVAFDASGQFTVSARIDGADAGSLRVSVASVAMSKGLSYVVSTVGSDVVTATSEQPMTLYPEMKSYIPSSDAVALSSSASASLVRCTMSSASASFIDTHLQTRLNHLRGPVVAECEVRVLVQNIEGRSYSPVLREYADGSRLFGNCVSLKNPFPGVAQKLSITNAGPIFADTGTSTRIVAAGEFDENNQANVYVISTPSGASAAGYTIKSEILISAD